MDWKPGDTGISWLIKKKTIAVFISNYFYSYTSTFIIPIIQIQCAKLRLAPNMPCISLVIIIIIIIMYGTSVTRNYIPSDLYGHKREIFYCAFSYLGHGPYIRRSDLANCKFTLVLALIKQAQCVQH